MSFLASALGATNNSNINGNGLINGVSAGTVAGDQSAAQQQLAQQQALVQQLQQQNGLGNQSAVYNQLQGVANGTGPNPAQAQLAQATGANVANQAALMAGQRGAGANVGLMARQAAQQGANTQQQSAGQAATLQANQSLNALNSMGGIANTQSSNLLNQASNANAAAQGLYGTDLNAAQNQNANSLGIQNANSGIAQQNASTNAGLFGGILNAAGSAAGVAAKANGGMVGYAGGGMINSQVPSPAIPQAIVPENHTGGPMSAVGQYFKNGASLMAQGGIANKVPVVLSPGERVLSLPEAKSVAQGKANPMTSGKQVPGTPKVAHNSYANDTVPAKLDAGSIVLPLNVMNSKDPAAAAHAFVQAILAKKGLAK